MKWVAGRQEKRDEARLESNKVTLREKKLSAPPFVRSEVPRRGDHGHPKRTAPVIGPPTREPCPNVRGEAFELQRFEHRRSMPRDSATASLPAIVTTWAV